jgi:hypothetical protein
MAEIQKAHWILMSDSYLEGTSDSDTPSGASTTDREDTNKEEKRKSAATT